MLAVKRWICLVLALCLLTGALPLGASAAFVFEEDKEDPFYTPGQMSQTLLRQTSVDPDAKADLTAAADRIIRAMETCGAGKYDGIGALGDELLIVLRSRREDTEFLRTAAEAYLEAIQDSSAEKSKAIGRLGAGVIHGKGEGLLAPRGHSTRAEVTQVLRQAESLE